MSLALKTVLLTLTLICTACTASKSHPPITDFQSLIKPVPNHAKFAQPGYYVWGGSVVKDDKGIYHMYYSRWKQKLGFSAWVTHSEIAHATAPTPTGPFTFKNVALPPRGKQHWDGLCTHNPTIHKFGDTYYLYYMGNTGDGKNVKNTLNWKHRNNQRIGVATSQSPNGPWKRLSKPIIDINHHNPKAYDALMTSNPSITKTHDGKYLLIYKAVAKHTPLPFGGPVTHLASISDSPIGPFKKFPSPIFTVPGAHFPAEDPYIWYAQNEKKYFAIVKDMKGQFTKKGKSLALFTSKDGFNWLPHSNPLASKLIIPWQSQQHQKVHRLERPQILLENGHPIALYVAVTPTTKQSTAYNIQIPLE